MSPQLACRLFRVNIDIGQANTRVASVTGPIVVYRYTNAVGVTDIQDADGTRREEKWRL